MHLKLFSIAIAYWIAIIILAHFFAPLGYIWTQNTISELASQGHEYKGIMQAGLIGFGALVILAVALTCTRIGKIVYPLLPIALYGLAILLSGIYCTAPIDPRIPYSITEAELHSMLATIAGVALSLAILWRVFVSSAAHQRILHLSFLVAVIGLSALFGLAETTRLILGRGSFSDYST